MYKAVMRLLGHDEEPEGNWVPTTPNGDSDYRGKGSQVADGNALMKGYQDLNYD